MSPIVKKALTAVAAKQVIDKINEKRHPEPSKGSRFGRLLLIVGGAGALFFLFKSGKLQPVIDKINGARGKPRSSSSNGAGHRDATIGSDRPLSAGVT